MFGMLSVLAELQRELIVVNTNERLASARARGRGGGRRRRLTDDQAAFAQRLYDERERTASRSPTCPAWRGQRCTATSTRPRPSPVSPRRPWSRSPDRSFASGDTVLTGTSAVGSARLKGPQSKPAVVSTVSAWKRAEFADRMSTVSRGSLANLFR